MASRRAAPLEGRIITADEIKRMGAWNAWKVLRRANIPFDFHESRSRPPMHLSRRRARSFSLASEPLVIVDGTRTDGVGLLYDIPASDIASIRVLSGFGATHRYGTGAGGGGIVIETKRGHP
ncbi:MAG: TonB-dependent receptor plug domain-containing protein [Longimicrobiaceae bacterium]